MALRISRDLIFELRIKLKSVGVNLKLSTDVYCDNQVLVKNTSVTEYMLNNNHNSINYHVVCEEAVSVILGVGKKYTATNLDDPLTKLMPYSQNNELLGQIAYDY